MVAQSEAVMATGVALVMGAGIAAMAAVNGGRLGGGGGLDRARGASTIPAERSGSGKGGYSTLGDLQIKGGGARQGTVKGTAAGNATGLFVRSLSPHFGTDWRYPASACAADGRQVCSGGAGC